VTKNIVVKSCPIALGVLGVAFGAMPISAKADTVVYDTITGGSWEGGGDTVGPYPNGNTGATQQEIDGIEFTDTTTGYISSLAASISTGGTSSNSLTFGIYTSSAGQVGSLVEKLNVTSVGSYSYTPATGTYTSGTELQAGQSYWAVVLGSPVQAEWNGITSLPTYLTQNQFYEAFAGGDTLAPGASSLQPIQYDTILPSYGYNYGLKIDVASPVPLPSAAWLLLSGLGGLGALVRRRSDA